MSGRLQSVRAKIGARLAIYKVWEPKLTVDLLIYRVWEPKLTVVLLFTECGSVN